MSEEKKPLLLFSGGLDSTMMLDMALAQGDVYTCYINNGQCQIKVAEELRRRKPIIEYLEKKHGHKVLRDTTMTIPSILPSTREVPSEPHSMRESQYRQLFPDHTWGQMANWLYGLLFISDGRIHSEVRFGGVSTDDLAQKYLNVISAWEQLQSFTKFNAIPFVMPLSMSTKYGVLSKMDPMLLSKIWICELPYVDDNNVTQLCGRCEACHTARAAAMRWEDTTGRSLKDYAAKAEADAIASVEKATAAAKQLRDISYKPNERVSRFLDRRGESVEPIESAEEVVDNEPVTKVRDVPQPRYRVKHLHSRSTK